MLSGLKTTPELVIFVVLLVMQPLQVPSPKNAECVRGGEKSKKQKEVDHTSSGNQF